MKWFRNLSDYDFYNLKYVLLKQGCRCEFEDRKTIGVDKKDLINLIIRKKKGC